MEDNPAVDPADEISLPEVGLAGGRVVPDAGHTHPQSPLVSPGGHAWHDGAPLLQVLPTRAGEAPGSVQVAPVQREVKFLWSPVPASHTALKNVKH